MFSPIAAMTRPVAAATPATTRLTKIILCRLLFIVSGNCGAAPTALGNAIHAKRSTPSDVATMPSHASSRIDVVLTSDDWTPVVQESSRSRFAPGATLDGPCRTRTIDLVADRSGSDSGPESDRNRT